MKESTRNYRFTLSRTKTGCCAYPGEAPTYARSVTCEVFEREIVPSNLLV